MKRIILLSAILLGTLCVSAQSDKKSDPDRAKYFIKGNLSLSVQGNKGVVYRLENPTHSEGITFEETSVIEGKVTDQEDVQFEFRNASTDYSGGFENNRLQFWRYDEELQEWQPDVETRQGTASFEQTKVISLLLLIDCSTSLGSDFDLVKENAKYFINLLRGASGKGNVKVGIIGFSTVKDTRIFDITELNESSSSRMQSFIDGLELSNGTALYYSMDKALDMLQDYVVRNRIGRDNYADSYIVTFTDGVDQTSQNTEKQLLTADEYYDYIRQQLNVTQILDRPIGTYVVGVKGRDIVTDKMAAKFDRVLSGISPEYKTIDQVSQLREEFQRIVSDLTRQWTTLKCYVPMGFKGKVGWTFSNGETVRKDVKKEVKQEAVSVTQKVKQKAESVGLPQDAFMGLSLGFGWESYGKVLTSWGIPVDFSVAVPLKKTPDYYLGGYVMPMFSAITELCFGPLLIMPIAAKPKLMIGAGLDLGLNILGKHADEDTFVWYDAKTGVSKTLEPGPGSKLKGGLGLNLRGGLVWRKCYTFADLSLGTYKYHNQYQDDYGEGHYRDAHPVKFVCGLHVGYVF